jgi:nitrile hydratase beta subunit-like protein
MTYEVGQQVRVAAREHEGHHRTPAYVKGKSGRVDRVHDTFKNPETRAYGGDGLPEQRLYLVGFDANDLWPGATHRLELDVYEHWLEDDE